MVPAEKEKLTVDRVERIAMASLSAEDRRQCAVYVDMQIRGRGEELVLGGTGVGLSTETIVVFIDEEPGKNWGHSCRYLLFDIDSGAVSEQSATFPPSLTEVPGTYRLIHRPEGIEDWALWSIA